MSRKNENIHNDELAGNENGGKKKKKEGILPRTLFDWITYIIIFAVFVMIIWLVAIPINNAVKKHNENKKEKAAATQTAAPSTSAPSSSPQPEGTETYRLVVADNVTSEDLGTALGSASQSVTNVTLYLHTKDKTYTETMEQDSENGTVESGSYVEKGNKIITRAENLKKNNKTVYIKDGDLLLVKNQLFNGDVSGSSKYFKGNITLSTGQGYVTSVKFFRDGTYKETTGAVMSGSSDSTVSDDTGIYERKKKYIKMESDSGDAMVDFYIYKGRATNTYFRLDKEKD